MNINRVTLCGYTGKEVRTAATQNGRNISRLSLATTRRYKDAQQEWQEKTQWHTCVAYGATVDYIAKIPTGAHVFLEGELTYREYEHNRNRRWTGESTLACDRNRHRLRFCH